MKANKIFKKRKLSLVILLLLVSISCSDNFLEIIPVDRIPKDAFFRSESDLITAVNGVYVSQRNIFTTAELPLIHLEETRSDNTHDIFARQNEHRAVDNFTADAGNNFNSWVWRDSYYCINSCNTVVNRAEGIEMDENLKNRLVAEARFIRATVYFSLVKDFGEVPIKLKESISLNGDNNLTKSSVEQVYDQIIEDLQFAITNLPPTYSEIDAGRATSGAAQGWLGKVELQRGNKEASTNALRAVVNSGQYTLLGNYADLWIPGNRNTSESIYEIQHLPPRSGAPYWNYFAPLSLGVPGGNNGNTAPNTPTQNLIDSFEEGDQRLDASIGFDMNGRPYVLKFKDQNISAGYDARNSFPVLRYSDVLLMLAEAIGESEEAYTLVNQVRARAGLGGIDASTLGSFQEKVMHERRVELAFELHRWHDLLRFDPDITISIMNQHLASIFPDENIMIDQHDLLNAIPVSELQTNSDMIQNEGY